MTSENPRSGATWTAVLATLSLLAGRGAAAADAVVLADPNPLPAGYSLSYDRDRWSDEFSVFRMSVASDYGVIDSTLAASDDPRLKPLTRLDTSWSLFAPILHAPLRIGDSVSSGAFWDEPVRMGGLQIGSIEPALPAVSTPAVLAAPDILTNPAAAAATPITTASSRFIDHVNSAAELQRQSLVAPGQGDYSLEMGRVREEFELRSNDYGVWLTSGTYRYGLNADTTLDGQFAEVAGQESVVGLGMLEGLGTLGQFSARLASSRDADATGWLARIGYDFSRDNLSIALRTHVQTAGYATVGDIAAVEPLRQRTLASAGWDMGSLGKISLATATQTYQDDSRRDVWALSHAMSIAGGGILSTAAAYSPGQFAGSALLLSVTYPFDYWTVPRRLGAQTDIGLDRTITDALNQTRMPLAGRVVQGGLPGSLPANAMMQ